VPRDESEGKLETMNIVFLGSGAFGIPALEALGRSQHRVLHVITQPDRPAGRGRQEMATPVGQWVLARNSGPGGGGGGGIGLTRTANVNGSDVIALLRQLQPECLVVIAFGQKMSDDLLATAPRGGINLHSSLLPKYRGAAPINWALINNDPQAGVSVIDVTRVMDAGDILATAQTPIGPAETAGELHDRLALLGAPLLVEVLDRMAAGVATRLPQDHARATRAPKLSRELAWVDFTQPAAAVSARIRGLSPWPGVQVELTDPAGKPRVQAAILKCRAVESGQPHGPDDCGKVLGNRTVACGTGSLEILLVQPAGKKTMELQAFANGYGLAPGARLRSLVRPPG
jgi:methionyl-tRNA formyltransferase